MTARVMLACFEAPGWGGASTVAHDMVRQLQRDGAAVSLVTAIEEADEPYYRFTFGERFGNPYELNDALTCLLSEPLHGAQTELTRAIDRLAPDAIVAIGSVIPPLLARAAPNRPRVLLTAGCQQAKLLIADGEAEDLVDLEGQLRHHRGWPRRLSRDEEDAVESADLIVPHNDCVAFLLRHFYPVHDGKIYPTPIPLAPWIHDAARRHDRLARPFAERDIDVLFVASAWDRPEKNYATVAGLAAALRESAVHVVGETERDCPHAVHHGLVADRIEVFDLMGRAKTVACPSVFDAAPGILFEAAALGCNLVASPNCGNADICHEDLLAPRATVEAMLPPLRRSLARKYTDRLQLPSTRDTAARLMRIASGLARLPRGTAPDIF